MDKTKFFSEVLKYLGMEPTPNRLNFLIQWSKGENTTAAYNPLATTKVLGRGETAFNRNAGIPVKNYATFADGVEATAKTLRLPYYKTIFAGLKNDLKPSEIISDPKARVELNTWGTGGRLVHKIITGKNPPDYFPKQTTGPEKKKA